MIKYRYALDNENNLIDINSLERNAISKSDKFYSVDFKQELIPRLGQLKVKHFAHKPATEILGSGETYLHALGKKVLKDEYLDSLLNGKPFMITYFTNRTCTRLKTKYNITCELPDERSKFDLTKYFTEIREEKKDGSFIPDLMLLNPTTGEKIYIEIAVTHLSSIAKIDSGNRIMEFNISCEEDIHSIVNFKNGESIKNLHFHNFKNRHKEGTFCRKGECNSSFYFFNVSKNGKCHLKIIHESEIESSISISERIGSWHVMKRTDFSIFEEVKHFKFSEIFKYFVSLGQKETNKVKNCYICRYHAENISYDMIPEDPIFCKFLKATCLSNEAAECKYYRIEQNYIKSNMQIMEY